MMILSVSGSMIFPVGGVDDPFPIALADDPDAHGLAVVILEADACTRGRGRVPFSSRYVGNVAAAKHHQLAPLPAAMVTDRSSARL